MALARTRRIEKRKMIALEDLRKMPCSVRTHISAVSRMRRADGWGARPLQDGSRVSGDDKRLKRLEDAKQGQARGAPHERLLSVRWLTPTCDNVQILRFKVKASSNSRSALGTHSRFSQEYDRHRRSYVSPLNRPPLTSLGSTPDGGLTSVKSTRSVQLCPVRGSMTLSGTQHILALPHVFPTALSIARTDPLALPVPRIYAPSRLRYNHDSMRMDR